jgi:hypothetical protein
MKTTKPNDRRNFLLAAGLGSAGVAAAVAGAGKVGKEAAPKIPAVDKPSGYQASAHVLKYYKTTEV